MKFESNVIWILSFLFIINVNVSFVLADELPEEFRAFFAQVSVNLLAEQLDPGDSFGNPARDDKNYSNHYKWAEQNDMYTVFIDLIEKFDRMAEIKNKRGKYVLARWYALVCTSFAEYGVDFGSVEANSKNQIIHYNWVIDPSTDLSEIKAELNKRIRAIYDVYIKKSIVKGTGESSLSKLFGNKNPGKASSSESKNGKRGIGNILNEALKGAMKSAADAMGESVGKIPVGEISSRLSSEPPAKGVAKIKDVLADPLYRFGQITSGAKLFIIGWNFGTRPGRSYIIFSKPVNGILQIDLEPFDKRGWDACWYDEVILARMPDLGEFNKVISGYIILELPNGQRVRDFVIFGKEE